jgi:3-hydroxyisobutyrate dehydrogenase-like beta-hydroxyacid dehydrogenase
MATAIRRVGIVGLGKMGFPMARHLRKAGFEVTACDISAPARTQAERAGIKVAASPEAVAADTDFVTLWSASMPRPRRSCSALTELQRQPGRG